jgi:hypothetical protein
LVDDDEVMCPHCGLEVNAAFVRRTGLTEHPPCTQKAAGSAPTGPGNKYGPKVGLADIVAAAHQVGTVRELGERLGIGGPWAVERLVHAGHDDLVAKLRGKAKRGPKPEEERVPPPAKLTKKQERVLSYARGARTLVAAAANLQMSEAAVERMLYRLGEHDLVSRLKGNAPAMADGASTARPSLQGTHAQPQTPSPSRSFVSGGREKRTLTADEVKAWQAARERARRAQVRPQFVQLAGGKLAEGRTATDDELRELARAERAAAYRQASRR